MCTWTYTPRREMPGLVVYLGDVFVERGRASWARRGTAVVFYLAANEPGHVATVTAALLSVEELDQAVPDFFEFTPMNKIPWAERLMASAALTGRTMVELRLPGGPRDLKKCITKEPLGPRLFHTLDVNVVVVGIAGNGPDAVAHSSHVFLCTPGGTFFGFCQCPRHPFPYPGVSLVLLRLVRRLPRLLGLDHVDELLEVLGHDRALLARAIDVDDVFLVDLVLLHELRSRA